MIPFRSNHCGAAAIAAFLTFSGLAIGQGATANSYIQHNLVADLPGVADVTDPNLVNPWGISESATSPFWISDNGSGLSTLYNGSGAITAVVVKIPQPSGSGTGTPTGQVNNSTTVFLLPTGVKSSFIFATENGTIAAWQSGTVATTVFDNSASGAVYKGLALGTAAAGPVLYAANFNAGTVDVIDGTFKKTTVAGGFTDATLPAGFAPFNIAVLGGNVYVTYAKQNSSKVADQPGAGNGFVNVFDQNGNFQKRLISNGALNSPWGLAIAPSTFGAFGGALLVGNFGDGTVNAYSVSTGAALGTLQDTTGKVIKIDGLWALQVGNSKSGGDQNTVYFTAGPQGETHGIFGSLAPPANITSITNAASTLGGPVAAGEIVVIHGGTIGASPLAAAPIPAPGAKLGTSFSSTSVTFNGSLAPIVYSNASVTAVQVPYELAGFSSANVVITYKNQTTAAFSTPVAYSAPGLFTLDFSGGGQLVALNQDGTLNSSTNAAAQGTVVFLFATGEGVLNPGGVDGLVTGDLLKEPVLPPTLSIGGTQAQILFAGSAPGFEAGVMEIEAIVPSGAGTGPVAVDLTINGVKTGQTVTIAVK